MTGSSSPTEPADVVGHGTACAGIIHALAPEAEIVSIRVLGPDNRGNGGAFATGLQWAIEESRGVDRQPVALVAQRCVLRPAPRAGGRGVLPERAARVRGQQRVGGELPVAVRVRRLGGRPRLASADTWFYNPEPPVEFGAYGLNVDVAWRGGTRMVVTGNSFAAPHIAGYAARIRAAHPGVTPFETKAILAATADSAE